MSRPTADTAEAWLRCQPWTPAYWDTADHAQAFLTQTRLTDLYDRTGPISVVVPTPFPLHSTVYPVLGPPDPAEAAYYDEANACPPLDTEAPYDAE